MPLLLDIGGEGRYAKAWNLNPSRVKTIGPQRGAPIERHIAGRAEEIPLPDGSVRWILVERTPLREAALREIARVIMPGGLIVLRHAASPTFDRHQTARGILPGRVRERVICLRGQSVQETRFHLEWDSSSRVAP
jgi:ubiquinone/menaquinone biosynthesis C-methylase UbiE